MKRTLLVTVVVVALLASPLSVAAAGPPDVNVYLGERTVQPGEANTLTLTVTNEIADTYGSARAASGVTVTARSGTTPIQVQTGTQFAGTLQQGQSRQVPVNVRVPADIDGGTYDVPVEVEYSDQGRQEEFETEVTVRVEREPRFEIVNSSSSVPVGGSGSVSVSLRNVGDAAAHESVVGLESSAGDVAFGESKTANRFVGTWETGETRTVTYGVSVANGADVRNYTLRAAVDYEDPDGIRGTSRQMTFGLRPLAEQTFDVDGVESSLNVGQRGSLSGTVTNTGPVPASNAVVVFQSTSPSMHASSSEYAVGTLAPNESAEFDFDVRLNESANAGPRQVSVLVRYRNAADDQQESEPIDVQTSVGPQESEFEIRNVESTLRVGEQGTLSGEVVNADDTPVTNAVVVFGETAETVTPVETEYALGDLGPGEAASFEFDTDVSTSADAGPRQFSFRVRYRDGDNVRQRSGSIDLRTDVAEETPEFEVERLNSSVRAGENAELHLRITNTRNEPVSDVSAKLYTESPLSTSDDEAFVEELGPGESAEIAFAIGAGGDAMEKNYPAELDFKYDEADGDTAISDTYQVPVSVTRDGNGGGLPFVGVIVAGLLAVGGLYVYRRR